MEAKEPIRGQRGLTLVEVIVAAAILSTTGLALAASIAQSHGLVHLPREEVIARNAIRSLLAEMAAAPFDLVAQAYHGTGFHVSPLRATRDDPDGFPGEIHFDYGADGDRSYYTVTVRVQWGSHRDPRVVESVSYLSNIRGDTGTPVPLEEIRNGGGSR
jgi:prepilin-type N-terminal cleavage/methylation domain-containing protein